MSFRFKKACDLAKNWTDPKGWQGKKVNLSSYPHEDLLDMADRFAEDHPNFNTEFTNGLREDLKDYGDLTLGQRNGLENVVARFKMYRY